MTSRHLPAGAIGLAALLGTSSPATAQIAEPYRPVNADRTGDDVLTRPRPELAPIGGRIGSFFLYPRISIDAAYTDNVRGTPNAPIGDASATARVDAQLVSDWGRHKMELLAYAQARRDHRSRSENSEAYGASLDGRYDIGNDAAIGVSVRADRQPEDRFGVDNARFTLRPVEYLTLAGLIRGDKRFGALSLQGGVEVVTLSFGDAVGSFGPVVESDRDDTRILYRGAARYDLTGSAALIVAGQYDRVDYATSLSGNRNSTGYRIEGGIGVELTHQIIGEIRIGYLHRDNVDPLLRDVGGVSFFANLLWSPTRLLSVRLTADRDIENSATLASPGNLRSTARLSASYEVLRQLIVTPALRLATITAIGGDGANTEREATLDATYRLNRQFSVSGRFRHVDRDAGLYSPVAGNIATFGFALTL